MMKHNIQRWASIALTVALLHASFETQQAAYAGSSSSGGSVAGITVLATKEISQQTYTWWSGFESRAVYWINVIGRTWWTSRAYCESSGQWTNNFQYGGEIDTNDNLYWRQISLYYGTCMPGFERLENLGGHDFKHNNQNSNPWPIYAQQIEYH